jgi:serine/threonine protein phosphatase PrpC
MSDQNQHIQGNGSLEDSIADQAIPDDTKLMTDTSEQQKAANANATPASASQREWWESESDSPTSSAASEADSEQVAAQQAEQQPVAPNTTETAPLRAAKQTDMLPELHEQAEEPEELEDGTRQLTSKDVPALMALRSKRGLAAAAQRDIGRVRSTNQDSVFASITTLPREGSDLTLGIFIVADGMGGHEGGEIASRLAATTVAQHLLRELVLPALSDSFADALQPLLIAAVQEANRAIWEQAQLTGSDMGTTCTAALLLGQALYVAHVGDSRAYLATPTNMQQLTTDHSAVGRLIQVGQLTPEEAREHPLRSQLYRTIGQNPEVLVDFMYQPLGNATHLLLCSDGLWGMLDDEVLLDVLEHSFWPQDACRELIARANLSGGDDNISAVVVTLPTQ